MANGVLEMIRLIRLREEADAVEFSERVASRVSGFLFWADYCGPMIRSPFFAV